MITMDDILKAAENASGGQWIVRKTVDDSGDYPCPTYDILALYEYGPSIIGCADGQPYNAILFASSKRLANIVKEQQQEIMALRADIESLKAKIEMVKEPV